jgi:uncharacterized protein YecE (DUF72 family)
MIYVGTCGYAYRDWVGPFYPTRPHHLTPEEFLPYYASKFRAVEIDSTYYHVPKWRNIHALNRRTPADFRFSFKAPATVTHPPEVRGRVHDDARLLADRLSGLRASGKLACVLAQFPNSFAVNELNEEYVRRVVEAFDGIPVVVEFRRRQWQSNKTLALLRELGAGYCNVDMPSYDTLLAPSADATSAIGYVRMHGRNAQTWWTGTNVTRYDYDYALDDLVPWSDRVAELEAQTEETFVFFNNHARGQAARNARIMEGLLKDRYGETASEIIALAPDPIAEQPSLPGLVP